MREYTLAAVKKYLSISRLIGQEILLFERGIMIDKEMYLEMTKHRIVDNPFDVMVHYSVEIVRDLLFYVEDLGIQIFPRNYGEV